MKHSNNKAIYAAILIGILYMAPNLANAQNKKQDTTVNEGTIVDPGEYLVEESYSKDSNEIFLEAEQMPEFKGGEDAMYKFLAKNLKYPPIAIENNIQGRVVYRFAISKEGKIFNIVLLTKSIGYGLEEEAKRIIQLMPAWTPAKQNGRPVNCYYTLPVVFKLN